MIKICSVLDKAEMEADYVQIIEGLVRRGHLVYTLLHRSTNSWKPNLSNLKILITKEPLLLDRISIVNFLLLKAVNVIRNYKVDVVYATGNRLGEGLLAGLLTHKPVLCDVRNPWSIQWRDIAERVVLKTILGKHARKIRFFSEELIINKAQRIVAYSNGIRDWLVSHLRVAKDKIEVIPPHVDTNIFHPNLDGEIIRHKYEIGRGPLIMYVGAINLSRGIDILIEAFSKVKNEFKDAKLMIVGPMHRSISPFLKDLEHKINILKLNECVVFTDYAPFREIPNYIAAADVLTVPHRRTFTYEISPPVKILEYMACRKPIVTTDVGIRDIVLNDENGIIVVPGDINELAEAIIRLLVDSSKAKRLANNARMFVEENFQEEMMIEKFENILVSLVNN